MNTLTYLSISAVRCSHLILGNPKRHFSTLYIAPKSKIESGAYYAHARGYSANRLTEKNIIDTRMLRYGKGPPYVNFRHCFVLVAGHP